MIRRVLTNKTISYKEDSNNGQKESENASTYCYLVSIKLRPRTKEGDSIDDLGYVLGRYASNKIDASKWQKLVAHEEILQEDKKEWTSKLEKLTMDKTTKHWILKISSNKRQDELTIYTIMRELRRSFDE